MANRNRSNEHELNIINAYIDTAKTFIQLSSAALILPLIIQTKLLGLREGAPLFIGIERWAVFGSWIFFLIAIAAGATYQHYAVKFVEYNWRPDDTHVSSVQRPIILKHGPGIVYGVMVSAFYLGAICIVVYSSKMLL
ncbi:MAG TPA: hypothetical protein VFJ16_30425 [Longimicrobium sp.]|nr:hypothetical protein [Longimicrobium sp.]